jgi:dual specificity tyrosine-phosphorylation-regulated kinase 2/3/4
MPPSKIPSSGQARKSVLGMHLPSMLRGSVSKKGLSQQVSPAVGLGELQTVEIKAEPPKETASLGWKGRARGKVSGKGQ